MKMRATWLILGFSAVLLLACGGGSTNLAGGVGSGGSGVASGAVTGFGSVIVDGVTYDDSVSVTQNQGSDGSLQTVQAQLGEQVQVVHDASNVALSMEIRASLIGPVSTTYSSGTGLLEVLGQSVRVVQVTDDSSTATVLSGYDLTSTPAVMPQIADVVKVHGTWTNEGTDVAPVYVLQATRIERLASYTAAAYLVSGRVISQTVTTATLNKSTGLVLQLPTTTSDSDGVIRQTSLIAGQPLSAWVSTSQWSSASQSWLFSPVTALLARDASPRVATGKTILLSGIVDKVDTSARVVTVQGITVFIPSAFNLPQKGKVVQMQLVLNTVSSTSVWMAQQLQTRTVSSSSDQGLGADVSLKEKIANPNWAQSRPFLVTVRGVVVQVNSNTQVSGCQSTGVGTLLTLTVKAIRPSQGAALLVARQVSCSS